jgi:hypothetical protein
MSLDPYTKSYLMGNVFVVFYSDDHSIYMLMLDCIIVEEQNCLDQNKIHSVCLWIYYFFGFFII